MASNIDEGIDLKLGSDIEDDGITIILNDERARGGFDEAGHRRAVGDDVQIFAKQQRKVNKMDRRIRLLLIDEVTRDDRRRITTSIGYSPGRVERATEDANAFVAMLYQDNFTVYRVGELVMRLEECMMFSLVSKIRRLMQKYT